MTLGLLILRVVVGLVLAAHAGQKLFGAFGGGGIAGTGWFFENHLRFKPGKVYATMAGLTELGAGALLALGFLTPFGAAAVVGVMLVAGAAAHKANGFFITEGGYEYNLVLGMAGAVLAFTGPGRLSVDRALGWDLYGTVWGVVAALFGIVIGLCVLAGRGRMHEIEDEVVEDFSVQGHGAGSAASVEGGREAGIERTTAGSESEAASADAEASAESESV